MKKDGHKAVVAAIITSVGVIIAGIVGVINTGSSAKNQIGSPKAGGDQTFNQISIETPPEVIDQIDGLVDGQEEAKREREIDRKKSDLKQWCETMEEIVQS